MKEKIECQKEYTKYFLYFVGWMISTPFSFFISLKLFSYCDMNRELMYHKFESFLKMIFLDSKYVDYNFWAVSIYFVILVCVFLSFAIFWISQKNMRVSFHNMKIKYEDLSLFEEQKTKFRNINRILIFKKNYIRTIQKAQIQSKDKISNDALIEFEENKTKIARIEYWLKNLCYKDEKINFLMIDIDKKIKGMNDIEGYTYLKKISDKIDHLDIFNDEFEIEYNLSNYGYRSKKFMKEEVISVDDLENMELIKN